MAQNVGRDGWLLWLMVLPAALLIAFLLCLASRSAFRSEGIACKIAEGVYTLVALFLCAFSLAMMSALGGPAAASVHSHACYYAAAFRAALVCASLRRARNGAVKYGDEPVLFAALSLFRAQCGKF